MFAIKVMRKVDIVRKNMAQSVTNEKNILAQANNPFVVGVREPGGGGGG
jgi:microtubule-associated serine/threonine kinase